MVKFSNPRMRATIENWPSGPKRVTAVFQVHRDPKKGCRVSRTTTGKPKMTTYSTIACIVDGDNGKTYILQYSTTYGSAVSIMQGDMQHNATVTELGYDHYVTASHHVERFEELIALLKTAESAWQEADRV